MDHRDNIERYLRGEMTTSEIEHFESELANNPELSSEFQFQKEVVDSIGEIRKAELKAQLDQVEIPQGFDLTGSAATKIIGSAIILGGIGFGIYYFTGDPPETIDSTQTEEPIDTTEPITEATPEETTQPTEEAQVAAEADDTKETQVPKPVVPDVIESFDDEEESDSIEVPDNRIFNATTFDKSTMDIQVIEDPDYNFHYKFVDDQLVLYGDFNNVFYEILEIKDEESGGIYLFYKDIYYALDRSKSEITGLTEITDQEIKDRLTEIRNK